MAGKEWSVSGGDRAEINVTGGYKLQRKRIWSRCLSPVLIKLEKLFVCLSVDGKLLN